MAMDNCTHYVLLYISLSSNSFPGQTDNGLPTWCNSSCADNVDIEVEILCGLDV